MSLSWRTILPLCLSIYLSPTVTLASTVGTSFTSPEHVVAGNNVKLHFSSSDTGKAGSTLTLPNGLAFTYGEILSMPDFYGVVDQAISLGRSPSERRILFLTGFNTFATNPKGAIEAIQIRDIIRGEQQTLNDEMKGGVTPEEAYKKIGHEFDRQYNCITGGGCDINTWWLNPGRYLSLVNGHSNYDHFGENALIAYSVGHQLALEQAVIAHENKNVKMLETAYAMNAFACHFLSDRFASGHIRTPRMELSEHTTPATAGSLLAGYMHDEENEAGLHVHNLRGDHWMAYGDKSYFNPKTDTHIKIMLEALQKSADAVFAAYQLGTTRVNDNVLDFVPQPDEIANASNQDISPLFYWDANSKKLMRRSNMSNFYDRHWTNDWWGWSTLIELRQARGLSEGDQAVLALSEWRKKALQSGLITNPYFIEYIKTH